MDDKSGIIKAWERRHGYTEEEAEVAYHLGQAEDLLSEILKKTVENEVESFPRNHVDLLYASLVEPHFRALYALLDRRVLKRDYPESLQRPGDPSGGPRPE